MTRFYCLCWFVLGLLGFLTDPSYADRVITPDLTIWENAEKYILGVTVEALNAGTVVSERVRPSSNPANQEQNKKFAQIMSDGKEEGRKLSNSLVTHLNETMKRELGELFSHQQVAPVIPDLQIDLAQPVAEFGFSAERFKNCVIEILPKLQRLVELESLDAVPQQPMANVEVQLEHASLKQKIRATRGDGLSMGMRGVVCGKYLGRGGFNFGGLTDDVKLASLVKKFGANEEFERLLTMAMIAYHRDTPDSVRRVWQKLWAFFSFEAHFKLEILPSWEVIRLQLQGYITDPGLLVPVPITLENLDRLYAEGVDLSAALKR